MEIEEGELEVAFTKFQESMNTTNKWYMDSGASCLVTGAREHLELVIPLVGRKIVTTADKERHAVGGSGDVNMKSDCKEINMINVMYVPSLKHNLVFVGSLTDKGQYVIVFTNKRCLFLDNIRNKDIECSKRSDKQRKRVVSARS